jgi:hypothetical protein
MMKVVTETRRVRYFFYYIGFDYKKTLKQDKTQTTKQMRTFAMLFLCSKDVFDTSMRKKYTYKIN